MSLKALALRRLAEINGRDVERDTSGTSCPTAPLPWDTEWDTSWPPDCLDAARRFGRPEARLYPLIGGRVSTPRGAGRLLQILAHGVRVVAALSLEREPQRVAYDVEWRQIRPLSGETR